MTDPKDIKIAAPEQWLHCLNDPDFLNQAVTLLPPCSFSKPRSRRFYKPNPIKEPD